MEIYQNNSKINIPKVVGLAPIIPLVTQTCFNLFPHTFIKDEIVKIRFEPTCIS
jgi:hypothetical protein